MVDVIKLILKIPFILETCSPKMLELHEHRVVDAYATHPRLMNIDI